MGGACGKTTASTSEVESTAVEEFSFSESPRSSSKSSPTHNYEMLAVCEQQFETKVFEVKSTKKINPRTLMEFGFLHAVKQYRPRRLHLSGPFLKTAIALTDDGKLVDELIPAFTGLDFCFLNESYTRTIATALLAAGVGVVVCWSTRVVDRGAIELSEMFYGELARGADYQTAFARAKEAVCRVNIFSWVPGVGTHLKQLELGDPDKGDRTPASELLLRSQGAGKSSTEPSRARAGIPLILDAACMSSDESEWR